MLEDGRYEFSPSESKVQISARAPGHTFRADGEGVKGAVSVSAGTLSDLTAEFALQTLDANDRLRNRELSKFLSFDRGPVATATMSPTHISEDHDGRLFGTADVVLTLGDRRAPAKARFEGHIPTVQVSLDTSFTALGYTPPKLLFLKVEDLIHVQVRLRVRRQGAR